MDLSIFLSSVINKIYKILPLYEMDEQTTLLYVERLIAELNGSLHTFPELGHDKNFISAMNNLNYILHCGCSVVECRRQVFDSIDYVKKVQRRMERGRP